MRPMASRKQSLLSQQQIIDEKDEVLDESEKAKSEFELELELKSNTDMDDDLISVLSKKIPLLNPNEG